MRKWRPVALILLLSLALIAFIVGCDSKPENLKGAFFEATQKGNAGRVGKCIGWGQKVNEPDEPGGLTALHYAVMRADVGMVKLLLEAGADPDIRGTKDKSGVIQMHTPRNLANVRYSLVSNEALKEMCSGPAARAQSPELYEMVTDPTSPTRYKEICVLFSKVKASGDGS